MTETILFASIVSLTCALSASAAELPKTLVEPYLQAQVILVNDETKGLDVAAKAIEASAMKLGKDAAAVASGANKLSLAKTITQARAAFGELSVALETYVDKTKATFPADVHLAYCPMEDKPWLQKGTDIKNPYYGAQMIDCGSIKK